MRAAGRLPAADCRRAGARSSWAPAGRAPEPGPPAVARRPAVQTRGASSPGLLGVLAVEDARAPLPGRRPRPARRRAGSGTPAVQRAAVRALGRLERRDLIPELLPYLRARDAGVAEEAAIALALAMRGEPLPGVSAEQQTRAVFEALALSGGPEASYRALGRLPYATAGQFRQAERQLARGGDPAARRRARRSAASSRWQG